VAEPWSDDFLALDEHTRSRLRSLDATRAALSARPQETKMRFFKNHPALTAVLAILALAVFAPLAYAAVTRVLLSIDTSKPAPEIEQDMRDQLNAAGVKADVFVDKSDDKIKVGVRSTDPNAPEIGVHVTNGGPDDSSDSRHVDMRVEVRRDLTPTEQNTLQQTLASPAVRDVVEDRPDDMTDDEAAARITAALDAAGFHGATVIVTGSSITVEIK